MKTNDIVQLSNDTAFTNRKGVQYDTDYRVTGVKTKTEGRTGLGRLQVQLDAFPDDWFFADNFTVTVSADDQPADDQPAADDFDLGQLGKIPGTILAFRPRAVTVSLTFEF